MTLVIVEGPDGAGKSTLIEKISKHITDRHPRDTVEVLHRRRPDPRVHALDEYVRPLLDYRSGSGRHVLCDRWHVGELVYPRVYDRPTTMDPAVWTYTDLFLRGRGALVVYMLPSDVIVARQLAHRVAAGGRLGETPPLEPVRAGFEWAYNHSQATAYRLTAPVTDELVVRALVSLAETVEGAVTRLADYVTYVGPARPLNLLVGDVRNGHHASGAGTAFMPYPATSGHYLLSCLALAEQQQIPGLGVVNGNDADDIAQFIEKIQPTRICALGAQAHKTLSRLGVDHGAVPHPQYVRRFFNHYRADYATIIGNTLLSGENEMRWRPENTWYDDMRSTDSSPTSTSMSDVDGVLVPNVGGRFTDAVHSDSSEAHPTSKHGSVKA